MSLVTCFFFASQIMMCFLFSRFLFRLYWYPLKALYSASYGAAVYAPQRVPCYELLNVLLLFLQVLHVYWFMVSTTWALMQYKDVILPV